MIQELTERDKAAYDAQANHLMQSWAWGEFRKKLGTHVVRQGEFVDGKLTRGWQLMIHPLPCTPFTIGYLPKGPLPDTTMLATLAETGRAHRCVFIQLEPNILANQQEKLAHLPLQPSARPLFTKHNFLIDLTQSEEALLATMHSKTRYNIGLAQRKGVTINITQDDAAFHRHVSLYLETAKRHHYFGHSAQYHQTLWDVVKTTKMAYLVQAFYPICKDHPDCLLASWMLIRYKDTLYYPYGGSSDRHRDLMASNLVAWEAIRLGKNLACKTLDLWGALESDPVPANPWYGFHRFKAGYGGTHVTYVGSFDYIREPIFYRLFVSANKIRWWILSHLYLCIHT